MRYSCTDWSTGSAAGLPPADELAKPVQILPTGQPTAGLLRFEAAGQSCLCKWLEQRVQVASGLRAGPQQKQNAANNSQNRGRRGRDRCLVGDLAGEQAADGASAGRRGCAAQAAGRLLRLRVGGAARQRLGPPDRALSLPELSPVNGRRL